MKTIWIFALLLGAAFGLFHIVKTGTGFTFVPKAGFTFVDTFISVDDVIERYNNRSFAEALRGNPQLDNLVHNLEKQGFISSSKKPDPKSQSFNDSGATSQAPPPSQPPQVADLSKYVGKHPTEVFSELAVQQKFKALLENEYSRFFENLSVASALELKGNFYVGSGCASHSCTIEETAFAIDKETGEVFASILSDGKTIKSFGVSSEQSLPAPLYAWYKEHGGQN